MAECRLGLTFDSLSAALWCLLTVISSHVYNIFLLSATSRDGCWLLPRRGIEMHSYDTHVQIPCKNLARKNCIGR
jgi:hypothetical protein